MLPHDETRPFVSLIVPAHNEAAHLRRCLASLVNLDYPSYEVILVDNASTDDTAAICREFPSVRYVFFDRSRSSYAARNEGVRHARGEVLGFFDADQHARPDYLNLLLAEYVPGDPHHVYVGRLADDESVPLVLRRFFSPDPGPDADDGFIGTASVALPRALCDELGGFREELLSGGDFEFFDRAKRVARVHRCREVCGYHCWAVAVGEYLSREERYAFGQCLRARAEGRPAPGLVRGALRLAGVAVTKAAAAALVPLRQPRAEWRLHWHAQLLHCGALCRRLRGIARFKLGYRRAGDLPREVRPRTDRTPAVGTMQQGING
jgi:glycosyltransferase involved in cell wall biosynthesis